MGSQTATGYDRSRMSWTPMMERYFLDLMLEHSHRGNRVGHTFNKLAWNDMLTMFNGKFCSQHDKDVLKSRYAALWKQFNDVKNLLCQIGFSWDASRQMVIANDSAWDAYIKVHRDARCYRTKSVQNFDDLYVIYGSTSADGRYSLSSHDASLDDEAQRLQFADELRSTAALSSNEHPRTEWTAAMDQFFIELLLDQLGRGNKVNNSFSKKAWTNMLWMFNTKFGSHHGKRFLRHRYSKLLKYYCDITVLLKEGFSWDKKQQMLAADDSLWNAYVKAHPHARAYRMKTLPNYHDLELIFRNESDGFMSNLHQEKNLQGVISEINAGDGKGNHNTGTDRTRTYWTPLMDRCLIDLLVEQVKKGNKVGQTFITEAWNDMIASFNKRFKSHHDKDVLKNRFKCLRRQYKEIDRLLQQSGFSWDDTREMVAAEDSVWDAYTKVHREAQSLRVKTLPGYRKLRVIFGEECNGKRYSVLASITNPNGELPTSIAGEGKNGSFPSVYDAGSTIQWTESMEFCFIDLMIEQVNEGNGVENRFNQQGWTHMIKAFSAKFGLQCDKQFLEDQYFCLMKQHDDISCLLNHDGFAWDDTMQMVIAENDVWEAYIKDHPYAISYRNRFLDLYADLCKIFGSKVSDARISTQGEILWVEADNITIEVDMDGMCGNLILSDNSEMSDQDAETPRGRYVNRVSGNSVVLGNTEIIEPDNRRPRELDLDGLAVTVNTEISGRDTERPEDIDMDGTSGNLVITANPSLLGPDIESTGKIRMDGSSGRDENVSINMGKTAKKLVVTGSTEIKDCGKKRRGEMPFDSKPLNKKPKKDQRIRKALSDMANAVKKLMNKKERDDDRSFQNAISALQAMPDIDEELVMDACDLLEDERKAKTFLALDISLRKKWLMRKLRSQ